MLRRMDNGLDFGGRVWTPEESFKLALDLTESREEHQELERLEDLARSGRLSRRSLSDGSVIYPVIKAAPGLKAINEKERVVTVAVSDATVDRYGDTIAVDGWDTKNHDKNPVVITDHNYSVEAIVGQSLGHRVAGDQFLSDHLFNAASTDPWAEYVFQKIVARSLRAVSVGFRAQAWAKRINSDSGEWTGGYDYLKQELYEESWVAVPANPNAVIPTDKSFTDPALDRARAETLGQLRSTYRRSMITTIARRFE